MEIEKLTGSNYIQKANFNSDKNTTGGNTQQYRDDMQVEQKVEKKVRKEELETTIKGVNEFLVPAHTSLKFQLHDKLDEYYVQIIDDQTKEVVREIPSKKFLDMYAAMADLLGLVVDEKV